VVIINGAPHPNAAWLFIDHITSPEGQFEYSDVVGSNIPLNKNAKTGKFAQYIMSRGLRLENTEMGSGDLTLDDVGAVIYGDELRNKSSTFFLELMGIR
jgi:ABC-type Fe3+ transport system substrate-binding protein